MIPNPLNPIDRSLKNKPAPIRRESKADIVMKKMFARTTHGAQHESVVVDYPEGIL
jgi:hypothetical protein